MATCVDIADADYPTEFNDMKINPLQGESLFPAFMGNHLERKKPLFWEWRDGQAIRDGEWKLVKHGLEREWDLYQIAIDPTETNNLALEYPEKVKEMDQQFRQWESETLK